MTEQGVTTAAEAPVTRVYEVGYHIVPTVAEDSVEKIIADIRSTIEKSSGGSANFLAEGAPTLTRLAYPIEAREGDTRTEQDRGYFGWIKYEGTPESAEAVDEALKANPAVMRHIVFRTVREETRARMKAPTLREVKRSETIRTTPRRHVEESSAPVSEAELDKAISELTND